MKIQDEVAYLYAHSLNRFKKPSFLISGTVNLDALCTTGVVHTDGAMIRDGRELASDGAAAASKAMRDLEGDAFLLLLLLSGVRA